METVLSGIRPTGNLHLGNYFGAVQNFIAMQEQYNCFFFIADWHSLTTHPTPEDLHTNVTQILAEYLACGIDPEKATLYIQSEVPEIAELYLLLNMNSYVGELERTTTFKDKIRAQPGNINAGLLTYPVLQTADIIIHKATQVPVGKDQEQNVEIARKYARRFNNMYNVSCFPDPHPFNFGENLIKIPGLDGSGKMGKSDGNGIYLYEDATSIRKKVMRAVTDSGPQKPHSEPTEPIQNLFTLMNVVSRPETVEFFTQAYADCSIRYGDMKKQLAEDIIGFTTPFKEKIDAIKNDTEYLKKIVAMGTDKARESASKTLKEVREIIGFKTF
ncbi:MAG: tryptophan--tRNA ligase [Bacteroidales bacterium]